MITIHDGFSSPTGPRFLEIPVSDPQLLLRLLKLEPLLHHLGLTKHNIFDPGKSLDHSLQQVVPSWNHDWLLNRCLARMTSYWSYK